GSGAEVVGGNRKRVESRGPGENPEGQRTKAGRNPKPKSSSVSYPIRNSPFGFFWPSDFRFRNSRKTAPKPFNASPTAAFSQTSRLWAESRTGNRAGSGYCGNNSGGTLRPCRIS